MKPRNNIICLAIAGMLGTAFTDTSLAHFFAYAKITNSSNTEIYIKKYKEVNTKRSTSPTSIKEGETGEITMEYKSNRPAPGATAIYYLCSKLPCDKDNYFTQLTLNNTQPDGLCNFTFSNNADNVKCDKKGEVIKYEETYTQNIECIDK